MWRSYVAGVYIPGPDGVQLVDFSWGSSLLATTVLQLPKPKCKCKSQLQTSGKSHNHMGYLAAQIHKSVVR